MSEGIYYLRLNGKVEGPFTIGQIYDLWAARKINSQTAFARFEEMDKWQPLSELTLKISAPKSTTPKLSPSETQVAQPQPQLPRQRSLPSLSPEDLASAMLSRQEESTAASLSLRPKVARPKFPAIPPLALSGSVMVVGVVIALYFAVIYPLSGSSSPETVHDITVLRQTGVLSGMSLVVTGSLLMVAQQIASVRNAIDSDHKSSTKQPSNQS
jgi:hypothetical protein